MSLLSGFSDSIRYLEYYHHSAQPMLSNSFDRDFWSRTTLQIAHSEPAVRHALVALAYLHSTQDGSMKHARSRFASQHESSFLLSHYNKSVRGLVNRIGEANYSHEIGLVSCLLFVCMEFLRGNYHTAFTHLTNGFKVISGYQEQTRNETSSSSSSSPSEMLEVSSHKSSSATSTLIEDELRPLFIRAMASAMLYGVDVEDTITLPGPSLQHYLRLSFTNFREVQIAAHELRNQSILHIQYMSRRLFHTPSIPFTPEEFSKQACMLSCQRAWYTKLQKFRDTHQFSKSDDLAFSILLTHYHAIHVWTTCVLDYTQKAFDDHLDAYKVMVGHARLVLDAMEPKPTRNAARYTFEISIIPALYFVATRCRCPTTRREAVSLLARNPPREGLWDAEQHTVVARRVIEMEEQEVDPVTGWPVQHTRLWGSTINADMDRNGGFWVCFDPVDGFFQRTPDGKRKVIQEFFVL
jgi:hypothetical protein